MASCSGLVKLIPSYLQLNTDSMQLCCRIYILILLLKSKIIMSEIPLCRLVYLKLIACTERPRYHVPEHRKMQVNELGMWELACQHYGYVISPGG